MPQANTSAAQPVDAALNAAFTALETYDQGSSRGALVPIDQAVRACLGDETAQASLEQRLVSTLQWSGSAAAIEFICSKLAVIGSRRSVAALAALLGKPEFATAARNALEVIPGLQATKALRDAVSKTDGMLKVGVINSLGVRRDSDSVRKLTALLKHPDEALAGAAASALGNIATPQSAKALRAFLSKAPEELRPKAADAVLTCAERLLADGKRADAQKLYRLLATDAQPRHVQQAAVRGVASVERRR